MRAADARLKRLVMATAIRILLWALVLIAPGGILLAPLLAAHELRRRSANRPVAEPVLPVAPVVAEDRLSVVTASLR